MTIPAKIRRWVYQLRDRKQVEIGEMVGVSRRAVGRIMQETRERLERLRQEGELLSNDPILIGRHPYIFEPNFEEGKARHKRKAEEKRRGLRLRRKQKRHQEKYGQTAEQQKAFKKAKKCMKVKIVKARSERWRVFQKSPNKKHEKQDLLYQLTMLYPTTTIPESRQAKGDFKRPSLTTMGEMQHLMLSTDGTIFHDGVVELGLPSKKLAGAILRVVWTEFAHILNRYVGPHQEHCRETRARKTTNYLNEGWSFRRFMEPTSDITYISPASKEKFHVVLRLLNDFKIGELLRLVPGFLGVPFDKLALIDLFFIALSHKLMVGNKDNPLHTDMSRGRMATLLVPLELPSCEESELVIEGPIARKHREKDRFGRPGPRKRYSYRHDAALLFKAGVLHNTNTFGHVQGKRLMLCLHVGDYNVHDWEADLRKKSFYLPPARDARKFPSSAMKWKKDYRLQEVTREGNRTLEFSIPPA